MALTTAQIHAAANQIDKQGNRPTLASVRAILGGGSFTTIQEGMKTWKKAAEDDNAEASEIPDELQEIGEKMIAKIWEIAESQAIRDFDDERQNAVKSAQEAEGRYNELIKSADQLSEENEKLTDELIKKQVHRETLEAEIATQREMIYKLQAALSAEKQLSKERLTTIKAMANDHQPPPPTPTKKERKAKKEPVNGELELAPE